MVTLKYILSKIHELLSFYVVDWIVKRCCIFFNAVKRVYYFRNGKFKRAWKMADTSSGGQLCFANTLSNKSLVFSISASDSERSLDNRCWLFSKIRVLAREVESAANMCIMIRQCLAAAAQVSASKCAGRAGRPQLFQCRDLPHSLGGPHGLLEPKFKRTIRLLSKLARNKTAAVRQPNWFALRFKERRGQLVSKVRSKWQLLSVKLLPSRDNVSNRGLLSKPMDSCTKSESSSWANLSISSFKVDEAAIERGTRGR